MSDSRSSSLAGKLAKIGVSNPDRAVAVLGEFPPLLEHDSFVEELALAPDPDLALESSLAWFSAADSTLQHEWLSDAGTRARWLMISGASEAFSQFLIQHPAEMRILCTNGLWENYGSRASVIERILASVAATWRDGRWIAESDSEAQLNSLRRAYRREVVAIAARDLSGDVALEVVTEHLSDVADAVIEAATAVAWASVNPGEPLSRFAVIAMGKCGGRELNYISDVDVIFVAEPFHENSVGFIEEASRLASRMIQVCETPTAEGMIWQVDPALRPEGKSGALVRTLDGHVSYYERWAETWEFQALLKAREMAGDVELGRQYVDAISTFVWKAAARPNFVEDVQAMRKRVIDNIPAKEQEREIKLGVGGLRDVEFAVQLLQLVHGRSDVMLRSSTTLVALDALATWGYVGREDAATLAKAYRFERMLEHRIQMFSMRRTHLIPESETDLRRLGRAMGLRNDPVASLYATWHRHKVEARRLHEKLFYRPLLQAVVRLDPTDARLSMEAARERLSALGFVDPENAMRHLASLSQGVSRRAAIQRTLLPVMLSWMAATPSPDAGLLGFRRVSENLGATPWYLRLLRDESLVAERLAYLLSSSRYFTDLLLRAPEAVSLLEDDESLQPRTLETLLKEMESVASRHLAAVDAVAAIRGIRQRELIRISASYLLNLITVAEVGVALTDITEATLHTSLNAVMNEHIAAGAELPEIAIIGLGRLGGRELNFSSDADICVVYRGTAESAASQVLHVISFWQQLLSAPAHDPALIVDMDLRPEGKQGPVARSLDSYAAYYERWALTWESQAMLRARAIAGSDSLGADFIALIDPLRYPENGLNETELREIRRIKARVESERLPRGANPHNHVKLGPGGISDVEWTAQLLQMNHAWQIPQLRTLGTLDALKAAQQYALIDESEREYLQAAWLLASEIRNGITLTAEMPSDSIPSDQAALKLLSFVLHQSNGTQLLELYRRNARRCRQVMQKYVYGQIDEE
ncbi:MAG: hypothetical protein RL410_1060 [Actinomycetota bacterium]